MGEDWEGVGVDRGRCRGCQWSWVRVMSRDVVWMGAGIEG